MDISHAWIRVIVDTDLSGHPVGIAVEAWDGDQRTGLVVLERPGPFDTADEAWQYGKAFARDRFGYQPTLL